MGNSGCICGKESTKDKVSDVEVPSKEKSKSTMNLPLYSRTVLQTSKPFLDISETKEQSLAKPRSIIK